MILKIKLRPAMLRTLRQLWADYQVIYRIVVPESVFNEMIVSLGIESMDSVLRNKIVSLGIESMDSVLKNKADSMKMEVCKNED